MIAYMRERRVFRGRSHATVYCTNRVSPEAIAVLRVTYARQHAERILITANLYVDLSGFHNAGSVAERLYIVIKVFHHVLVF